VTSSAPVLDAAARPGPSGLGRLAASALAVALGAIAAVILGEIALRIASPASLDLPVTELGEFLRFHPRLGWTNRPGAHGRLRFGREFDNEVLINSKGLRDREVPYDRRPGTLRVLALGDSYTFGQGVEARETWPKILETRLGPGAEVLNAGVSGWGTAQELLWLEDEGFRYRPDVVVLGFYVNDFWDNAALPGDGARPRFTLEAGRLAATNLPLPAPRNDWLVHTALTLHNHSLLYRLFEQSWRSFQAGWLRPVDFTPIRGKRLPGRPLRSEPAVSVPAVDLTGALLSEMERSCRARGARFVVLLIPGHWQVRPAFRGLGSFAAQRDAYAAARSLCLARKLRALDPYPELAASEERGVAVYNPTDMHWNAAGHGLAAGLLADALRDGQP
jgi:hypothetical protein